MNKELELLKRKFAREEAARVEAEMLLEKKSLELYNSNSELKNLNNKLEDLVEIRTRKLRESELEYQTMVESINDMIFRLSLDGKITFTNQIVSKILGIENANLVGKHVLDFIASGSRKSIFIHFAKQFLNRNCINYYEIPILTRHKQTIWVRLNVQFSSNNCQQCVRKQDALAGIGNEVKAKYTCNFSEIIIVAHDITQQKLAQERLEKSEKRYRELTESLPEMICELDKSGTLTYVNKFALEKFGYSREEVVNNNFSILNIFPKEHKKQVKSNLELIYKYGRSTSTEYLAQRKNRETFSVIVYTSPIYDQNKIIGLRGVMFDITDRKNHELEISKNLKQQALLSKISLSYNSLFDFKQKTNEAIRLIGDHLNISRVYIFENSENNKFTSNTFEWCNKNIIPQKESLQNIAYSNIPSWKKILKKDKIVYSEDISELPKDIYDILEPQGIKSIIVLPLLEHGKQFGFIGFDECIIHRKWNQSDIELLKTISNIISNAYLRNQMQQEIINSEKETRIIINSIPDVILQLNSEGKIKSFKSPQNFNLFSKLKNDETDTIYSAFSEKLARSFVNGVKKCLVKGSFQFDFRHISFEIVEHYEARFVKLTSHEVMAIIRNVTELKENEKQLRIAITRAEDASRSKSEFLANVSHEIRTPLNAILGFSQWLNDNTENQEHRGYLKTILSSGRNLLNLINDILNLSKIESGKMDIDMQPMQYLEIITDIKMVFQQKIKEAGMTFQITTDKSVPVYIYMDELRFYQVIFNLVSNAVKFTSKGFIHINAYATKTEIEDEINLVISVEDTGIGIKADQQNEIFESFKQQSGQSNRNYEGTGLGLAIVTGLLKKLNGSVKLKSKVGKGSLFTVTFYNVKVDTTEHQLKQLPTENEQLKLAPCTIMIVDDVDYNVLILKQLIDAENVTFIEAKDGSDALAKITTKKPDLVFMDIRMPGMSGYDVTEILKEKEEFKNIPVIAFTASTVKHKNDRIDQLFDGYLQKPVFKNELNKVLQQFLSYEIVKEIKPILTESKELTDLSINCMEALPDIINELEYNFLESWNEIKDNLVIYDIEAFKEQLEEFASQKSCDLITEYCDELDLGLQSFDIEAIEKQLNIFPELIDKLKKISNKG